MNSNHPHPGKIDNGKCFQLVNDSTGFSGKFTVISMNILCRPLPARKVSCFSRRRCNQESTHGPSPGVCRMKYSQKSPHLVTGQITKAVSHRLFYLLINKSVMASNTCCKHGSGIPSGHRHPLATEPVRLNHERRA